MQRIRERPSDLLSVAEGRGHEAVLKVVLLSVLAAVLVAAGLPYLIATPNLNGSIPEQPFSDSAFADVGGIRMHWRARGPNEAGALIILLHGFGGSGFSWRHSLDALEGEGYQVLAPDLPPFGYSQRTANGPDWPDLVIELAEAQGADLPWVLVGHSMGVSVAAEVTNRRSERVSGLIMVGGTPQLRRSAHGWSWLFRLPPIGRWAEVWAARNLVAEDSITRMLSSALGRAPTAEEFNGYRRPLLVRGTYPALLRRMSNSIDVEDEWVGRPTAVIWGEFDSWVPIERAEALIDRLSKPVALHVVVGASHNPMDTHPAAFNRLMVDQIKRFLTTL